MISHKYKLLAFQQKVFRRMINFIASKLIYYSKIKRFPDDTFSAKLDLSHQKNCLAKFRIAKIDLNPILL